MKRESKVEHANEAEGHGRDEGARDGIRIVMAVIASRIRAGSRERDGNAHRYPDAA